MQFVGLIPHAVFKVKKDNRRCWLALGLFNYTFLNCTDYVAPNGRMSVNKKLERVLKEAAMAYFKVLSQNLPGGTEKNHKIHSQDSWSLCKILTHDDLPNAGVLTTQLYGSQ
jgi:hypothetical protein